MGYYGVHNLGDEMMLFCLERWLARQQTSITVVSEYPQEIRERYGLPVVETPVLLGGLWRGCLVRSKALRFYGALWSHSALVVGGGDLIRDDQGWGSFLFTMDKIMLAWLMGCPVYLVNIGIGRPTRTSAGKLLNFFLRRCRGLIVRDKRSLALCVDAGAGSRTHLAPDIVMTLPRLLGKEETKVPRDLLLICLRTSSDEFGRYSLDEKRLKNVMARVEECASALGLEIVFVSFQRNPENDDDIVHKQAAALLLQAGYRFVDWGVNFSELVDLFFRARLVLAMRLHAAVLAAATGASLIFLPYDHTVDEFARDYPSAVALSDIACDDPAKLETIFASALNTEPNTASADAATIWQRLRFFGDNLDVRA